MNAHGFLLREFGGLAGPVFRTIQTIRLVRRASTMRIMRMDGTVMAALERIRLKACEGLMVRDGQVDRRGDPRNAAGESEGDSPFREAQPRGHIQPLRLRDRDELRELLRRRDGPLTHRVAEEASHGRRAGYMLPMMALMRRTPADDDCSFWILKLPSSFVFCTCGPQQISFDMSPIV